MAQVEILCEIPPGPPCRADRVVREATECSRGEVRGLFDHGCVSLNGEPCEEPGRLVSEADQLLVRYDPHTRYRERPRARHDPAYRLIFEDSHLLVVNKAAAVLTVPTERRETNTLLDALERYLDRKRGGRPWAVHRLDRGTSGLLVFAKNKTASEMLQRQFRAQKALREYDAIAAGEIAETEGTITSRLTTTRSLQRHSVGSREEGELAITHFRVIERLHGATYLRVRLETGRRNQIRVHLAERGRPILGDPRYQPRLARHRHWRWKRLALHAALLGFAHPVSGEELRFESPLPREMATFLRAAR